MPNSSQFVSPPRVLCISGHDPSGGAGLQADIETINACSAFAQTVPTCLTVQNQNRVQDIEVVTDDLFRAMFDCLLETGPPAAIKIGLLGNAGQAKQVAHWRARLQDCPMVMDPVLRASSGYAFGDQPLVEVMRSQLLPQTTITTPNHSELQRLTGIDDLQAAAEALLALGTAHVLVTGGDVQGEAVENRLFSQSGESRTWTWHRLPYVCHGSGCTLASALAAFLARGLAVEAACERAQLFTQQCLAHALACGEGPRMPWRHPHPAE